MTLNIEKQIGKIFLQLISMSSPVIRLGIDSPSGPRVNRMRWCKDRQQLCHLLGTSEILSIGRHFLIFNNAII